MTEPLVRRSPFKEPRPLYATCDAGFEDILAHELTRQGIDQVFPGHRGVGFFGGPEVMWRANLACRVANRVLMPLAEFPAPTAEALYEGVKAIDWGLWMAVSQTFAIDSSSHESALDHTGFVTLKAKDALCDAFRDFAGRRPNVDKDNPDVRINVRLDRDQAIVSLDTSGERLHRRGYRTEAGEAPLKETLAAGLLYLAGWQPDIALIDPFCGSGTILIEAALMARNIAPGLLRLEPGGPGFGFTRLRGHEPRAFDALVNAFWDQTRPRSLCPLVGGDHDEAILKVAKRNLERAGVEADVTLKWEDFSWAESVGERCMVVTNPPYGERLSNRFELEQIFKTFGRTLKQRFAGQTAWILAGEETPIGALGLRADEVHPLRNGPLECRLSRYAILPPLRGAELNARRADERAESSIPQRPFRAPLARELEEVVAIDNDETQVPGPDASPVKETSEEAPVEERDSLLAEDGDDFDADGDEDSEGEDDEDFEDEDFDDEFDDEDDEDEYWDEDEDEDEDEEVVKKPAPKPAPAAPKPAPKGGQEAFRPGRRESWQGNDRPQQPRQDDRPQGGGFRGPRQDDRPQGGGFRGPRRDDDRPQGGGARGPRPDGDRPQHRGPRPGGPQGGGFRGPRPGGRGPGGPR